MNSFNDCSLEHQYKNARNMKSYLLIIEIVASICNSYAQFNFKPSMYHAFEIDFIANNEQDWAGNFFIEKDRQLDSAFKLSKEFDFQFRLWKDAGSSMNTCVFIMTLSNKKWTASYFHFNPHWKEDCRWVMLEEKVDSSKLLQLWELLRENNILTLQPDGYNLAEKEIKYKIDTIEFRGIQGARMENLDGTAYNFELIKPLKRRSLFYGNPELSFKEYPYIKEFAQTTEILYLIKRYLGIPLGSPFR